MSSNPVDQGDSSRRSFILSTGGLVAATWLGTQWAAIRAAAHHAEQMPAAPATSRFEFLSPAEAADVDAIASQIVPSGATPGAREAHAVYFVDRARATFFTAQAGDFRAGLRDCQQRFAAARPAPAVFAAAAPDDQMTFLRTVDHTPFFDDMRMLTIAGLFASPKYGGNFQGEGWKMIGFEDRHSFAPPFGYYDARYPGFAPYTDAPS